MSKQNSQKKEKPVAGLSLAAGLLKGLNNERAALDGRDAREEAQDITLVSMAPPTIATSQVDQISTELPASAAVRGRIAIPVADCVSNPYNPREFYPEAKIQELALTLRVDGQIEPIKVTKLPSHPGKYVLIDGERRLRAMRYLGEAHIDAEVREDATPVELYSTAYRANNDHERQTVFDDAIAWRRLLDDTVFADQISLAERIGKDKAYVSKVLALNSLSREMLQRMAENHERVGLQAAYFVKLIRDKAGDEQAQRALSSHIEGKKSVRQLELLVRDLSGDGKEGKKATRTRYHQLYDFKANGTALGQLKTFPDGRVSLELVSVPQDDQEALAERIKAVVDEFVALADSASQQPSEE